LSGSAEAVPPGLARLPSIEGRRAARVATARREQPIVDLLNRGGFGRRDRGAGRPDGQARRREMAPQTLEKIESAPEDGSVPEAWRPQYLVQVQGRVATFIFGDSLRLSAAKKLQTLAPKRLKSLARLSTLHAWSGRRVIASGEAAPRSRGAPVERLDCFPLAPLGVAMTTFFRTPTRDLRTDSF